MYEIVNPTNVLFGVGSLDTMGRKAAKYGKKAFVVTGKNFVGKTGLEAKIKFLLEQNDLEFFIFNKIEPQPDMSLIEEGKYLLKENKCDLVIAIGGGSVIDSGKGIALLSTNNGSCIDFLDSEKISNNPLPLIAVPTTAGTGSEVTRYAVFFDRENMKKFTIKSEKVCPKLAIVDPELTLSLPIELTKVGAIDCLVHCIEGYLNTKGNPYTKALSLSAIKTIVTGLSDLIENPMDIQLREDMMFSSTMGGIVINNARTGVIHTMAAAIEPYCNLFHGEIVGRLLPKVLIYYINQDKCKEELVEMFEYVYGEKGDNPILLVKKIKEFILSMFTADDFKDQNISQDLIDNFIERVFMDKGLPEVCPIEINLENLQKLFKEIL